MASNMLTLADVTPTAADRIAVDQAPAVAENNQMKNRLMAMQVKDQGQSLLAKQSYDNYLVNPTGKPTNVGEFQAEQESQKIRQASPEGQITQAIMKAGVENDQTTITNIKNYVNSNPQLKDKLSKNGDWATFATMQGDPMGNYHADKYWTKEEIAGASKQPGSPFSPANEEGYYKTSFTSPAGAPLIDPKTQITKAEPIKTSKEFLLERVANGDMKAQDMLNRQIAATAKDFSEPYTMKIGGKPVLVQKNALTGEIKRLAEDKSTTVVVKPGDGGAPDDFRKWTKQDKEWWFQAKKDTGDKPDFGLGKYAAASRAQFSKEYSQWAQGKGITGRDAALGKETYKADSGSLKFTTKQLDSSKSFIKTIDNNIGQLERHIGTMSKSLNLDQNRILNMGIREFNQKLIGNANINIYDMLTNAISTENAKLQAGGAGSVAQVAESARIEMKRIHDANLPVSEMIKLMKSTREEGGNRIKGLQDTRSEIEKRMKGDDNTQYANNPKTGHRIKSNDGGKTWVDAQTGKPL